MVSRVVQIIVGIILVLVALIGIFLFFAPLEGNRPSGISRLISIGLIASLFWAAYRLFWPKNH
jgi:hypothetical protein